MHKPQKHWRCLKIYAGYDKFFRDARWLNKKEASNPVQHPPSSPTDDSIPWVDEAKTFVDTDDEDFDPKDADETDMTIAK